VNATVRLVQNGPVGSFLASGITDQDACVPFQVPNSVHYIEVQRKSILEKPRVKFVTVSSKTSGDLQLKEWENN